MCIVSFSVYLFFEVSRSKKISHLLWSTLYKHFSLFSSTSMYYVFCDKYHKKQLPQKTPCTKFQLMEARISKRKSFSIRHLPEYKLIIENEDLTSLIFMRENISSLSCPSQKRQQHKLLSRKEFFVADMFIFLAKNGGLEMAAACTLSSNFLNMENFSQQ